MLYEYALEPELINNWKDFRYFTEKFGVSKCRLISRYPKRWKKMVYDNLYTCGEIERKRIEEKLRLIDDRFLIRQHEWDNEENWLSNAMKEHNRRPFRAILAKTNSNQQEFVLEGDNIDETHPLWNVCTTHIVQRNAISMAGYVAPLLRISKEILFIDPHFGPENLRYRRPLEAFLATALEGRPGVPLMNVEVHLVDKVQSDFFKETCEKILPQIIPTEIKVRFIRWHEREGGERFHNRYILTERGGVSFGVGLDEGPPGATDEINLLDIDTFQYRWRQYSNAKPAFDIIDELVIEGKRKISK